jgi:hypothetical protein
MRIRPAKLADCAGLAQVQVDSYRNACMGIFPPESLDHFTYAGQEQDWPDLLDAGISEVLLATVD